jgi:serine/threonine protein kinase|tara:strand:- start:2721 stop:4508 length:1788 start_codon:yes stop_codon:yes gene_type:complete
MSMTAREVGAGARVVGNARWTRRRTRTRATTRGASSGKSAATVDVDERGLARALREQGLVLRERVDQGSFAVVYRAVSDGLKGYGATSWQGEEGTVHAVKILSATASTVSSRRDFKREATILTRVDHPGIVKVQYYGETPQPFMVTEFCTSGNLWNAMRAEEIRAKNFLGDEATMDIPDNMPLLDLPTLVKDVTDALIYLHRAGFAHRDLKTPNILLTWSEDLNRIQAKLCDFGSAAPVNKMPRRPKRGTLEKVLGLGKGWQPVGTMLWMAPEMLRPPMEGEELAGFSGDKSDVYALGVVLWECTAWKVPWTFEGTPNRARVIEEIVEKSSRLTPRDKSSRTVTALLDAMFRTSPAERPSANDVATSLNSCRRNWDTEGKFEYVCSVAATRAREVADLLESTSVEKETQNVIEQEALAAAGEKPDSRAEDEVEQSETVEPESRTPTASQDDTPELTRTEDAKIRLTDIDPEMWLGEPGTMDTDLICSNLVNMIFPHVLDAHFTPEMAEEMAADIETLQELTEKFNNLKRRSRTDPFAALSADSKGREVKRMTKKIERIEVQAQIKAWDQTRTVLREQLKKADEEYSAWRKTLRRL